MLPRASAILRKATFDHIRTNTVNNSLIEYWTSKSKRLASVWSSMVPPVGASINIAKKTYTVTKVTYALDDSDLSMHLRVMRANVDLKLITS
jgi:hypothetical protein